MAEERVLFTDGAVYERTMGRWSARVGEVFLDWLAQPKGLRWVDVGCGNGAFTEQIVARCAPAEVQALDPSEPQISYARTRPGVSLARFLHGDAQALPFADASFDVAAMALVITFVPDPSKAVAELTRVVRPSGWVATYMWDILGGGLPFAPIDAAMKSIGAQPHLQLPGGAEISALDRLQALWQQVGLESIETRVIDIRITYSGFNDFWETNSAPGGPTGRAIMALPSPTRERLREQLRDSLPRDAEGCITYAAHANAVKGRVRA